MFRYFVSFQYTNRNVSGFGNAEIVVDKEVSGINDVRAMAKKVEEDHGLAGESLVILNYIKLP